MPRRRRDCPICSKKNLAKLSNHLADIHQLSGEERQHYLSKARSLSDQRESEEMLNQKRMWSESDDEMSKASSSDERTSKETLSEKKCEMNTMTKHQQHLMKISSVHQAKKSLKVPKK